MKIVDLDAFLKLPAGTLFAKYSPIVFDEMAIKGDTTPNGDFYYQSLIEPDVISSNDIVDKLEEARVTGNSFSLDLNCEGRDGCFNSDQLFAVWDRADTLQLIDRLLAAVDPVKNDR